GRHVQSAVLCIENGTMRPARFSKVDVCNLTECFQINHTDCGTVRARLAYTGIPINRHPSRSSVRRRGHFVPRHTTHRYGCNLALRFGIDDTQSLVSLVYNQQDTASVAP